MKILLVTIPLFIFSSLSYCEYSSVLEQHIFDKERTTSQMYSLIYDFDFTDTQINNKTKLDSWSLSRYSNPVDNYIMQNKDTINLDEPISIQSFFTQ